MAQYFKGAGPGSHYWLNDPRTNHGFQSAAASITNSTAVIRHITNYSHPSPFVSISRSFAIARSYALTGPFGKATTTMMGKVFELDIDPTRDNLTLHFPITTIVQVAPDALLHDGDPNLLGHVAAGGTPIATTVNGFNTNWVVPPEVHAATNALRDAEILVERIPPSCIINVHDVF